MLKSDKYAAIKADYDRVIMAGIRLTGRPSRLRISTLPWMANIFSTNVPENLEATWEKVVYPPRLKETFLS
jgi:hypothetical protein